MWQKAKYVRGPNKGKECWVEDRPRPAKELTSSWKSSMDPGGRIPTPVPEEGLLIRSNLIGSMGGTVLIRPEVLELYPEFKEEVEYVNFNTGNSAPAPTDAKWYDNIRIKQGTGENREA